MPADSNVTPLPDRPHTLPPRRLHLLHLLHLLALLGLPMPAHAFDVEAVTPDGMPATGEVDVERYALHVAIHDQVAAAEHRLTVWNQAEEEVELTCELSLQRAERVDSFSYWNGADKIVGEVLEKQAATRVYDELTGVRRDPGILEQTDRGFRFRVFPVAPGEHKPVELRTVRMLTTHEGWLSYRVPLENLPRGADVELHFDISDDLPIAEVQLDGIPGRVERLGPRRRRVRFEVRDADFDDAITLRYRLDNDDYAMRLLSHRTDGEDGSFMLAISPRSRVDDDAVIGRDVVFVTDVSGSMQGEPLAQSQRGLAYALEHLSPNDRFEVVSFDDEAHPLFGGLRTPKPDTMYEAADFVAKLEATGGTNIHGALLRAVELLGQPLDGRPQAIIFLTDGQGSTPPEVITADLRARARSVRIYPFGAGDGVNHAFLQRLADDNRGIATFVQHERDLEREMRRLYDRISMPLMVDLELSFEGIDVESVYPKRLPDLYRDSEVIVFGRYRRWGHGRVVLKGRLKNEERSLALDVELPKTRAENAAVEKLWASRRVTQLLASLHTRGDQPELRQEITRLGIVYNLVTPYTTFLAVPASLQTDAIKAEMRAGKRGYEKRLIDSMQGIRLSQSHIPPGDPVLTVHAPRDSRRVIAYFPFGLVKRMAWDPVRERFHVRFLVPRDVADGEYVIRVEITDARGAVRIERVRMTIDGTAPEFEAALPDAVIGGEDIPLSIDPFEPVREVYAYVDGAPETRVTLALDPKDGRYRGALPTTVSDSAISLPTVIVVRDLAGNRYERHFDVGVVPDVDCEPCEDVPGC